MHRKLHVIAATLSAVLFAGGAFAQTPPRANSIPVCPPGCIAVQQCNQGCGPTSAEASRRAAIRRRRAQERRDRARAEQERLARERAQQQELARQQAEQVRLARERAAQEQLAAERAYQQAIVRKRADNERFDREERDRIAMAEASVAPARGGGPNGWRPHLVLALDGGVSGLAGGAHNATSIGPMWGARVGLALTSWFGIEGRYIGMWNPGHANATGSGVGLLTNGGFADLRFSIPTRFVRPYVFGGFGGLHTTVTGSTANIQTSSLHANDSADVPFGAGIDVPIGNHFGLGLEGTFHYLLNESFSTNTAWSDGDFWTVGTFVRVAL